MPQPLQLNRIQISALANLETVVVTEEEVEAAATEEAVEVSPVLRSQEPTVLYAVRTGPAMLILYLVA